MVREIIQVQVGQCGNNIGTTFWETVMMEHLLGFDGDWEGDRTDQYHLAKFDKIGVYFKQSGDIKYTPRAVLVDLEPSTLDTIKGGALGKVFKPDNFISYSTGGGNNWAKGHYTEGAEIIDQVVDVVRKEVDACDCLQGFQITHALGGGTGSGLGTLLLTKIHDNYPDRITCTYSVYPSEKVSDVVVEPYNATLSMHQLLENSDETFVIDNEALFNINNNYFKLTQPTYTDLNWVISLSMSGVTSSLRFSGKLNGDLRKLGLNLVPFPRLHFFTLAQAPLFPKQHLEQFIDNPRTQVKDVKDVNPQLFSSTNCLANVGPLPGKYLSVACIYRGNISTSEVDNNLALIQEENSDRFVNWIPNNIKSSIIKIPTNVPISGTLVGNSTEIQSVFKRISEDFGKMYKRKAFFHWYTGEGMDPIEFQEADKNVRDLITEYQDKQDVVVDPRNPGDPGDEEDEDEEEEE